MGGTLCVDLLSAQHWNPSNEVVSVLMGLRQMLCESGARVDVQSDSGEYSMEEASAAMFRTAR